jgi:predicted CXXCH cytochrome family protein
MKMEGMSLRFTNDIHYSKEISCDTCHGGDRNETNQNISMNASRGFKVRVKREGVPDYCGRCHSDSNYMGKIDPQLPTDQLEKYKKGIHGTQLAAGRKRAAECVDCHSVHDIRPPSNPLSKASPQQMAKTCSKCHAATSEAFTNSKHARLFNSDRRPSCAVCHDGHATQPATTAMLTGANSVCLKCHREGTPKAKVAEDMAQYLTSLEAAGPDKKDALNRARVAVHSLSLDAMKTAAEAAVKPEEK